MDVMFWLISVFYFPDQHEGGLTIVLTNLSVKSYCPEFTGTAWDAQVEISLIFTEAFEIHTQQHGEINRSHKYIKHNQIQKGHKYTDNSLLL